jgi:hypothetical protein
MQETIEKNIRSLNNDWELIKRFFRQKYTDPKLTDQLITELDNCTQSIGGERVYHYTERFDSLVCRIASGGPINTQTNIILCERGFVPQIREEIAKFRASKTLDIQHPFEFRTLQELYDCAANVETGLQPRAGRHIPVRFRDHDGMHNNHHHSFNNNKRPHINNIQNADSTLSPSSSPSTTVNKIEMTPSGQPVNVNKRYKPHNNSNTFNNKNNNYTQNNNDENGDDNDDDDESDDDNDNYNNRNDSNHNNQRFHRNNYRYRYRPFYGTCFGCQQRGHRIEECPQRHFNNNN